MARLSTAVSPAFDEELIHRMRTTIKKMRALSAWAGVQHIINTKYLVKLYKTSGRIRDTQLLLKQISDHKLEALPSFVDWLNNYLQMLKEKWQSLYDEKKLNSQMKQLKKELKDSRDEVNYKSNAQQFTKERNDRLAAFQNERPLDDQQIHSGRKTVKEIQFVNNWKSKHLESHDIDDSTGNFKTISDYAGDFMDTCSAMRMLEMYIKQENDENARNAAQDLVNKWNAIKDNQYASLLESMDSMKN